MSAFTPVKIDIAGQIAPYYFYKRIDARAITDRAPLSFKIDSGYSYFMRRAVLSYPQVITAVAGDQWGPYLSIEFLDRAKNKPRQKQPIPFQLISTPAGWRTTENVAPAPVDATAFNVNFGASVRPSHKLNNYFYAFADVIEMEVTGFAVVGLFGRQPDYFDVMLEGYNIPERTLSMWGKGGTA